VVIPVPVSAMEKAGTYTFVLHFYDDYADSYRNHQVKAALEVNQQTPSPALHIWVGQNIAQKLRIYRDVVEGEINRTFSNIGVTVIWHWGSNYSGYSMEREQLGHRLSLPSNAAEEANKSFRGVHVLLEDWPQGVPDESLPPAYRWYGRTIHPMSGSRNQYSPRNPATTYVKFDELLEVSKSNFTWTLINTLIHEFTHAASRGEVGHCSQRICIMYPNLTDYHQRKMDNGYAFYTTRSLIDWLLRREWTYRVPLGPWHSVEEIILIRQGVGLEKLDKRWLQQR
jgi:hypothetical protein